MTLPGLRCPYLVASGMVLGIAGLLCGCGQQAGERELFPTTGELFVRGEPAAGALLAFHPLSGDSPEQWPLGFPHALVDAAGRFAVGTYGTADGCPEGEYAVLITWPAASVPEEDGEVDDETLDRLAGRYATRESSPLTATVEARPTTLPRFELD